MGNPLGMNMVYSHLNRQMRTMTTGLRMMVAKPDGDLVIVHEQQTLLYGRKIIGCRLKTTRSARKAVSGGAWGNDTDGHRRGGGLCL